MCACAVADTCERLMTIRARHVNGQREARLPALGLAATASSSPSRPAHRATFSPVSSIHLHLALCGQPPSHHSAHTLCNGMFSNWIQAVENLAQHSPKSSQDLSAEARQARPSLEKTRRGSQSSLTQRSASPAGRSVDGAPRPRTTLEDRIRAKLAASASSETVNSTSPSTSSTGKSSPAAVPDRPASPASTPLPDSPALPSATIAEPLKTRSPSPVVSLNGKSEASSEALQTAPTKSKHAHAASVDVVWHPLSPTSTPLPDSPPSSPDTGASNSATSISIHSLVSEASLRDSSDSMGSIGKADAPSTVVPSPTSTAEHHSAPLPDVEPPTSGTTEEPQFATEVVTVEMQSSDVGPTEEPVTETHDQANTPDPMLANDRPAHSPPCPPQEPTLTPVEHQPYEPPVSAVDTAQTPSSPQPSEVGSTTETMTIDTPSDIVPPPSTQVVDQTETASQDFPAEVLALPPSQDTVEEEHSPDAPQGGLLSLPTTPLPTSTSADRDGLVEGLQKRLKLVEQRFAGKRPAS